MILIGLLFGCGGHNDAYLPADPPQFDVEIVDPEGGATWAYTGTLDLSRPLEGEGCSPGNFLQTIPPEDLLAVPTAGAYLGYVDDADVNFDPSFGALAWDQVSEGGGSRGFAWLMGGSLAVTENTSTRLAFEITGGQVCRNADIFTDEVCEAQTLVATVSIEGEFADAYRVTGGGQPGYGTNAETGEQLCGDWQPPAE